MYMNKPILEHERDTRIGKGILVIGGSLVLLIVVFGSYALDAFRRRRNAWKFQKITKEPKRPKWVSLYDLSMIKKSEVGRFAIYTKYFIRRMEKQQKNEAWKDRSKRITEKIRNILDRHFENEKIDLDVIPDSTIILCIAMPNFKNRCIPGDFEAIQKGPDDSYFEYQMIGDDRIEACYYNVDGKRYVAGICIYMENPYQSSYQYHTSILLKLLRGPVYVPKEGLAVSNVNETSATMETLISEETKEVENQNDDLVDKQTLLD